jgi:hypothetical protein
MYCQHETFNTRIRQRKKIMNHKQIRVGDYFLNCAKHPVICTDKNMCNYDIDSYDVEGNDLITGKECLCSMIYCRLELITKEQAYKLVNSYNRDSRDEYYGYANKLIFNNYDIIDK